MKTSPNQSPIAIVGVSALFPGSIDDSGFWRDILEGRDLIREVPETHWLREDYFDADPAAPDKTYATRGAFLEPVAFDALGFGVPPNVVPATDTSQLLALIVAQRVLEDASRAASGKIDRERVSVILGVTSGQELLASMVSRLQRPIWTKALREAGLPESKVREACERIAAHYVPWQENTFPGLLGNVVAGRIANRFDTGGTNCVVDAACASSFAAMSMAVDELRLGRSDLVISGGVDTLNDIFMYTCFAKTQALSRTGDCRPFSDQADGTLLGEGLAMFALKRLEDAERDGDRIYALLKGIGSSSDGRAKSVYAPRPEGQARALRQAYAQAGYGPQTVELVEAHGTGTKAGDVAEVEGLALAFGGPEAPPRQWCALGSVKSQIGHAKAAAGAAGFFKIMMALLHGTLPPTLKVTRPNPKLGLEKGPFYLNTQTRPWVRGSAHPRRAGVSSFGFGGSNFHLTLEEYRGAAPRALLRRTAPAELVVLGAESPQALCAAIAAIEVGGRGFLQWFARHSQESCPRDAKARLGVVARDESDLRAKLQAAAAALAESPEKPIALPGIHASCAPRSGGIAFLFSGQGSQYVGMGADLAMNWRDALEAWDLASDLVGDGSTRLEDVVFPRPAFEPEAPAEQAARLKQTEWAQPGLGAAALAQLRLLSRLGLRPDCAAGHSFGEVVALHAAGAFDARAMLRIARRRGELMAEAARTPGAMSAALASIEKVRATLEGVSDVVVANHNAPSQVVLSGPVEALERAEAALRAAKIKFERLPVATAFHSPVVAASAEPFAAFLAGEPVAAPSLPVYSNTAVTPYPREPDAIRALLASQLARPVRFLEQIEAMHAAGVRLFVELGAGSVLTSLVGKILAGRDFCALSLDAKGKNGVAAFHEALARLWAAGHALDFAALWAEFQPVEDPRKAKKLAVALSICGANYGKPYPPVRGAAALPKPNPEPAAVAPVAALATAAAANAKAGESPQAAQPAVAALPAAPSSFAAQGVSRPVAPVAAPSVAAAPAAPSSFAAPGTLRPAAPVAAPSVAAPRPTSSSLTDPGTSRLAAPAVPPSAATAPSRLAPLPLQSVSAPGWLAAYLHAQRETLEAHSAWQRAMTETHQAFLATMERSLAGFTAAAGGLPAAGVFSPMPLEAQAGTPSSWPSPRPAGQGDAAEAGSVRSRGEAPVHALASAVGGGGGGLAVGVALEAAATSGPAAFGPAAADGAGSPDAKKAHTNRVDAAGAAADPLKSLLLSVISEKTGYPVEMLSLDLGLEADLGIDSIKRVEILSALQERVPSLPEVNPAKMAALRTIGDIVSHLDQAGGGAPRAAAGEDLRTILLAIVSEKTGYPAEMLSTDLNLEGDLGIDSIKRVEILSAVHERVPGMRQVEPAALASLRTLGAILEHLDQNRGAGAATSGGAASTGTAAAMVAAAPAAAVAPAASMTSTGPTGTAGPRSSPAASAGGRLPPDLKAILLGIVSEKTGYPAEMLSMDLNLEGDLGIDSIKRVEILSAVHERVPALPQVEPAALASLRTLGAILEHLDASPAGRGAGSAGVGAGGTSRSGASQAVAAKSNGAIGGETLEVSPRGVERSQVDAAKSNGATGGEASPASLRSAEGRAASPGLNDGRATGAGSPNRFAVEAVETPAPGLAMPHLAQARRLVVTEDGAGVADALVAALSTRGWRAEKVSSVPADADGVFFLGGLGGAQQIQPEAGAAIVREAFQAARSVAVRHAERGGFFVTVQDTGGDFGLGGSGRAWLAGIAGVAKTAAQEWPQAVVRALDVERGGRAPAVLAEAILDEILRGAADLEVGLAADGRRRTMRTAAQAVASGVAPALGPDDVVLATGGARGVTGACLVALARRTPTRFVLLGRTALGEEPACCRGVEGDAALKRALLEAARAEGVQLAPPELARRVREVLGVREVRATLEALRGAGAEARYHAVDGRDRAALETVLEGVRREWGPVTAIVHGAGVLADKRIADKSDEAFARVFDTKVLGLRVLLESTANDPVRLIALFSSIAARLGNPGQCDYAAANETLNKVAAHEARRRGASCIVKSLGWGPWNGGMVDPALRAHFSAMGTPLIDVDAGARAFVDELSAAGPTEILLGAPLVAPRASAPRAFDVVVDRRAYPQLDDHRIDGVPVLPFVQVIEWFVRAAKASEPSLSVVACRDIRMLRGVRLEGLDGAGDRLTVACRRAADRELALELSRPDGTVHYTGRVLLAEANAAPNAPPAAPAPLERFERGIYGHELFHGPEFQVVRAVEGVSGEGLVATVAGTRERHWPGTWQTDAAALDGGLQLALLWSGHVLGGRSLPTSIGSLQTYRSGTCDGPLRCILRGRVVGEARTTTDLAFVAPDGSLVCELQGVESHRRPEPARGA